ncbi:MAG: protease complex subunit PrcB family protein [Patescibacteria group bacterium]
MTQKTKHNSGNILIFVILGIIALLIGLKFFGPKLGLKLFKENDNSIEYSHVEGFPKVIKVNEDVNKTRLVITDEQKLKEALAAIDKNGEIKFPKINFERKMALLVTSKTRQGGGYETRIKKIVQDKDDLVVEIRDTEPGDTCINTEELNLPVDLVLLDKTDLTIEFQVRTYTKECN